MLPKIQKMENSLLEEYRKEALRIEEDSIHSSKGHYNAAARWRHVHLWIGIPNSIIAAIAGITAFNDEPFVAGILAIVVAAISSVNTFLNPSDVTSTHKNCGSEYLALRNRCRIFHSIVLKQAISDPELQSRFEELVSKRDDLNSASPQIPEWAFKKAKIGIDAGQATHKS